MKSEEMSGEREEREQRERQEYVRRDAKSVNEHEPDAKPPLLIDNVYALCECRRRTLVLIVTSFGALSHFGESQQ